jgi:hypothetical protein
MKQYFLGEIYITHKKTWFGWVRFNHLFTTDLIEATDWLEAKQKYKNYVETKMATELSKYRYEVIVSNPVK